MAEEKITVIIELPSHIMQQEVWDLEEQLKQIDAVEISLQEPKDIVAATVLVLQFITTLAGDAATVVGGTKAVYDVAKILYDFLHRSDKVQKEKEAKKRVVILKKGKRIELYDLSIEEIEHILNEQ
jgi:hypothetical protein